MNSYKRLKYILRTAKPGTFISVEISVNDRYPFSWRWYGLLRFEVEGGRK